MIFRYQVSVEDKGWLCACVFKRDIAHLCKSQLRKNLNNED